MDLRITKLKKFIGDGSLIINMKCGLNPQTRGFK